jgi:hypothetical protein
MFGTEELSMAESGGTGKKILLWGCGGCVGLVVIVVAFAALSVGLAVQRSKSERVVEHVLEPEVHAVSAPAPARERAPAPVELPDAAAIGLPGRVELDLWHAEYHIEPAAPGESLRVEARFDDKAYRLEEKLDSTSDAEYAFRYRVHFKRTAGSLITGLKEMFGGTRPDVRVYLPPDIPIELHLHLQEGGSMVELGGLTLTSGFVEFNKGGFMLSFDEPVKQPLEQLVIRGSMGGFEAGKLGNASPASLEVDINMGGADIDLRGLWLNDSEVSVRTRMGGGAIWLPDDVQVTGTQQRRARIETGGEEVPRPTIDLTYSASMGGIDVIH